MRVRVGIAFVDFKRYSLVSNDEVLEINAKEIDLLAFFRSHRGQVIARDRLLEEVWKHHRDSPTRTVDNFIVRLRRKIESNPEKTAFPSYGAWRR